MSEGLLLLDKAVGSSSFKALYPVKRLFKGKKIGHAGTLDPAASGLLVVGVGGGTRLMEFFESMPKKYRFDLQLGITTDTYDLEGKILEERDASGIREEQIQEALVPFRGFISQLPPAYSAVKIQGKRACDRMRAGETVVLSPRNVHITSLEMLAFSPDKVTLEMSCSKGTYVRTIAHDIGQVLKCGAVAKNIRRLSVGPFRIEDAFTEEALKGDENLLPIEKAVAHMPGLQLRSTWIAGLLNGNPVPPAGYIPQPGPMLEPFVSTEETLYGIFSPASKLIAVGTVSSTGQLLPRKVLQKA